MRCYIYKSLKKADTYLYITQEDDFASLPEPLLQLMGEMQKVLDLELSHDRQLARADVKEVMAQLQDRGFYLQMPPPDPALLL